MQVRALLALPLLLLAVEQQQCQHWCCYRSQLLSLMRMQLLMLLSLLVLLQVWLLLLPRLLLLVVCLRCWLSLQLWGQHWKLLEAWLVEECWWLQLQQALPGSAAEMAQIRRLWQGAGQGPATALTLTEARWL